MQYSASLPRDANGVPMYDPNYGFITSKTVTFTNSVNANGDYNGTGNPSTIFTVTGSIRCKLMARCTTGITGPSATLSVGTALSSAGLIASTTAENIDTNEIWHDATPDASVELSSVLTEKVVSQSIIATVGTADISAGVIEFTLFWHPMSYGANVVAA